MTIWPILSKTVASLQRKGPWWRPPVLMWRKLALHVLCPSPLRHAMVTRGVQPFWRLPMFMALTTTRLSVISIWLGKQAAGKQELRVGPEKNKDCWIYWLALTFGHHQVESWLLRNGPREWPADWKPSFWDLQVGSEIKVTPLLVSTEVLQFCFVNGLLIELLEEWLRGINGLISGTASAQYWADVIL